MRDALKSFSVMVLVSMMGGVVSYIHHCQNKKFDLAQFAVTMACSGLMGVIAYGLCDLLDLTAHATAAVVAMTGYCGGSLLDAIRDGMISCVDCFFKAIIEKLTGRNS